MQFSNLAFVLQVAAIAAAAAVPLNGVSDAILDKRLEEAHADVTQVSYGPICHLHCRREKAAAAAAAAAKAVEKREPVEVDVQQSNYCLPGNLNCPYRRTAAAAEAVEKREPVEVDVQQSNYCLPGNLNCPYRRTAAAESVEKREPNSGRPEARTKITQDEYHYKGGKRDPSSSESVESVEKREPVEVDVQQSNYCLNPYCPYRHSVETRDADVYPDTQAAQE